MEWNGLELPPAYYQDDAVYIIHGDCRLVLPLIPDKSIDLVLTSPPYDNLRDYGGQGWDFEQTASKLPRVLNGGAVMVWVTGDACEDGSETGTSFKQALYFKDNLGLKLHDTMIYLKDGFRFPAPNRYHQVFEYMFVFTKGHIKTVNLIRDKKNVDVSTNHTNLKRDVDGSFFRRPGFTPAEYGCRYNVWQYGVGKFKSAKNGEGEKEMKGFKCDKCGGWYAGQPANQGHFEWLFDKTPIYSAQVEAKIVLQEGSGRNGQDLCDKCTIECLRIFLDLWDRRIQED